MRLKTLIVVLVGILIVAGLGYSLYVVLQTGTSAGIVTCPSEGNCVWSAHIHSFIPISICGAEYRLPIEVGNLNRPHTHEEKNIAHWHDTLPYDMTTQTITNTEPLTLGAFFDEIKIPFAKDRIADKKNGDSCDGTVCKKAPCEESATVKMFINGKSSDLFRNYIWRDKDVIQIFFDSRSSEKIEKELQSNPVTFPKLGRG